MANVDTDLISDLSSGELSDILPSSPPIAPSAPTQSHHRAPTLDLPPPKKTRLSQQTYGNMEESRLGVQSDDVQPRSSSPAPPIDNSLLSDREFSDVLAAIRQKRCSIKKLLRTIMWNHKRHHYSAAVLADLLKDDDNPFARDFGGELALNMMEQDNWTAMGQKLRGEVNAFGTNVVGKFEVPETLERSNVTLTEQLSWLGDGEVCRQHAPVLSGLLVSCARPQRTSGRAVPWLALSVMIAQLAYLSATRTFNHFAICIGMFLSHHHASRQALDTLNALGMTCSYLSVNGQYKRIKDAHIRTLQTATSMLNRAIVYDNLNRVNRVQEARAGHESALDNITTGLWKRCQHVKKEGLLRSMLDFSIHLSVDNVLPLTGPMWSEWKSLEKQLHQFYIFDALRTVFPNLLKGCERVSRSRRRAKFQTTLPDHGRPKTHNADWTMPLGPLLFDETTNVGTQEIFHEIFENQFKIDENDPQFTSCYFLMFGDALTTSRQWTYVADQSEDRTPYGNASWVIPVFGLWHLLYNYAKMIIDEHWGGHEDDMACLHRIWNRIYVNRKCDKHIFQVIDALILQSFRSRFVALSVVYLRDQAKKGKLKCPWYTEEGPLPDRQTLEQWWQTQPLPELEKMIFWIEEQINILYNKENGRLDARDNEATVDDEWKNHLHFIHNVFPYALLSDAIRFCDTGLIRHAIRLTLVVFATDTRFIYQRELCHFNWLINSSAATKEFQDSVIRESLINRQGRADTYYPMDLANELLNLLISKVKAFRRTSSLQVSRLIDRVTRTAHYMEALNDAISEKVGLNRTTYHTTKNMQAHIWLLATDLLNQDSAGSRSIVYTPGRGSRGYTRHLWSDGQLEIDRIVTKYNEIRVRHFVSGLASVTDADGNLMDDDGFQTRQIEGQTMMQLVSDAHEGRLSDPGLNEGPRDTQAAEPQFRERFDDGEWSEDEDDKLVDVASPVLLGSSIKEIEATCLQLGQSVSEYLAEFEGQNQPPRQEDDDGNQFEDYADNLAPKDWEELIAEMEATGKFHL